MEQDQIIFHGVNPEEKRLALEFISRFYQDYRDGPSAFHWDIHEDEKRPVIWKPEEEWAAEVFMTRHQTDEGENAYYVMSSGIIVRITGKVVRLRLENPEEWH